jgi:hypothetical protein
LIVTGLTMMKERFGRVYAPMVCGNHGRNTARSELKRYHQKNFDLRQWQPLVRRRIPHRFEDCGYVVVRNPNDSEGRWKIQGRRHTIYGKASLTASERRPQVHRSTIADNKIVEQEQENPI